jgi:hypothetical protein
MNHLESSFDVMALLDLLQWISGARKSGRCCFRNGPAARTIYFKEGGVIACSANEPHLLLGQFLIAQGRIEPEMLQKCMRQQESSGRTLGTLLVESGAISEPELQRRITAKAEETILGLFDWEAGYFRFEPDQPPPADAMVVGLDVHGVLLEGCRRTDECNRWKGVFPSGDLVLHTTERRPDEQAIANYVARRLYDSVDGKRTLSEIVLTCRSSRFHALSFLGRLVEIGVIRVGEPRQSEATRAGSGSAVAALHGLVSKGSYGEAVELVARCGLTADDNDLTSMLVAKAEAGFLAEAYRTRTPPGAVPHRLIAESSTEDTPLLDNESLLLELIDGRWDVRSLVWIAPMRKVDTVRALIRLIDLEYIDTAEPASGDGQRLESQAVHPNDVDSFVNAKLG